MIERISFRLPFANMIGAKKLVDLVREELKQAMERYKEE